MHKELETDRQAPRLEHPLTAVCVCVVGGGDGVRGTHRGRTEDGQGKK